MWSTTSFIGEAQASASITDTKCNLVLLPLILLFAVDTTATACAKQKICN